MATGPKCFRCRYDMPSGPVDPVCLAESIAAFVMFGLNG